MSNPWTKKNPFMSMWLSGANSIAGSARSRMTADGKRQAASMMTAGANEVANFWRNALTTPSKKRKR